MTADTKFNPKSIVPDRGCIRTTELYDMLPPKNERGQESGLALMLIEAHKDQTTEHSPECFVSRAKHAQ